MTLAEPHLPPPDPDPPMPFPGPGPDSPEPNEDVPSTPVGPFKMMAEGQPGHNAGTAARM